MSQNEEPSVIEYARFYGLIRDHLEEQPLKGIAAPHDFASQLDDTADLFQIREDCVKVPEERLSIDAATASLLSEVAAVARDTSLHFEVDDTFDVHRVRRLKHELPLLRTDHEFDLLRFAPRIVPDLEHAHLPLENVDEEADEGLTWPSAFHKLPDEYDRRSKAEKLVFPREALIYLQETLKFHLEGGIHEVFEEEAEVPYTRKTNVERVTPPLLPMSPVTLPFVPSSDSGKLELLSDHTSPTGEEAREVERKIFRNDAILPTKNEAEVILPDSSQVLVDIDSLGELYSPLKVVADLPSSPPLPRRSLQDGKVDVPLSPPASEQLPPWKRKSVSWKESLTEVVRDVPSPIPKPEHVSSDDIDALFEETIRPVGIEGQRSIEQEQLQEADTTLRVTVPIMDFSLPIAPWKACTAGSKVKGNDLYKEALSEMKNLHFSKHIWPMSGKLERELKWTPFPAALGRVQEQESISDDGFMEEYLAPPDRVDVETLIWKPDGLRIFDELAESDEEVEEGDFPQEKDIQYLLKKRKFELEDGHDDLPQRSTSSKALRTETSRESEGAQPRNLGNLFAGFSAMGALDSYIGVRKGVAEKPDLTADRYFPPAKKLANPYSPKHIANTTVNSHDTTATDQSLPLPAIDIPTIAVPFVISASFMRNRKLSRQIQRIFPSAELIERDFNLYLESQQRFSSKPNAGPTSQSTVADEADIILSPGTGLVLTTLQKIKQRSLPGQVARSAVRERITAAAPRYERLLVLVNEDRQAGNNNAQLDNSDCEALVEFTSFCLTLQTEVLVTFVAGDQDDLAKWIVAIMVKHGVTDPNMKLIQDETLWEVFLRRAGMNAFAAQAVLGSLKAPHEEEADVAAAYGLTAFVQMPVEERIARFETLLGGRRLLTRVSRVLDARW